MDTSITITKNAQETKALGAKVGNSLKAPLVLCLYGELGSGKTTYVQGLAQALGITTRLLSPTYIIVRRYNILKTNGFLYHLDLYRVNNIRDLGFEDMIADHNSIVVIEWADRIVSNLPKKRIDIYFQSLPNGNHKIIWKRL